MKKILLICSAFMAFAPLFAAPSLRIGSYNLRMSQLDKGDNLWEVRKERLKTSFAENNFDLCGLQEVSTQTQKDMAYLVGDEYGQFYFSPYHQHGRGNKAHGFIYRKSRLELLETHRFWPGENPDSMCVNDIHTWKNGKVSKFKRGATYAIFKDLKTGKKFCFLVSHAALNQKSNAQFAHVYIDRDKMYNPDGLPCIFVGDLNTQADSKSSEIWRSHWEDSFLTTKKKIGPEATFNSFKLDTPAKIRIDFIYVRGKMKVKRYVCNDARYNGLYASDHYPIYIDVKF